MNTTATPASTPAPKHVPAPAIGVPQANLEVARELAGQLAWAMAVQCQIIQDALSIEADGQARFAFRELRRMGVVLAKALEPLGPQPGLDDAVVPTPKQRMN